MSDRDTKGIGCGVYPLLLEKSYFADPCSWHDISYLKDSWVQKNMTRKQCDDWFLRQTLEIAGSNKLRRAQAYLFYGIARALGGWWWENKETR